MLKVRGRFDDHDVVQIALLGLTGLLHQHELAA